MISDFKIFSNNAFEHEDISPCFETAEFWGIFGVTTILRLLRRRTPLFFNL